MRPIPIRVVAVLFFLEHIVLGFGYPLVNAANAQNAWVLWEKQYIVFEGQVLNPGEWGIVEAFPAYERCVERQRREFMLPEKQPGFSDIVRPYEYVLRQKEGSKTLFLQELKCLPDTIDPRGKPAQ